MKTIVFIFSVPQLIFSPKAEYLDPVWGTERDQGTKAWKREICLRYSDFQMLKPQLCLMFCRSKREGGSASKGSERKERISSKLQKKEEPVVPQAVGILPHLWSLALPTVLLPLSRTVARARNVACRGSP